MSLDEKSAIVTETATLDNVPSPNQNVLTITRPSQTRQQGLVLSTIHDVDSTHSLSPPPSANHEKNNFEHHNSPYQFNSADQTRSDSKMNVNAANTSFDHDLEAQGLTLEKTTASQSKSNLIKGKTTTHVDPVWPCRNTLKQQRKLAKRQRAFCKPWAALSKKTKGIIYAVSFFLVLGLGLGVGIGLSKRVGGTITTGNGTNKPIN